MYQSFSKPHDYSCTFVSLQGHWNFRSILNDCFLSSARLELPKKYIGFKQLNWLYTNNLSYIDLQAYTNRLTDHLIENLKSFKSNHRYGHHMMIAKQFMSDKLTKIYLNMNKEVPLNTLSSW